MTIISQRFWAYILRPEVVFTFSCLQAISPYVFWQFGVGRAVHSEDLSYVPAEIFAIGWVSFLCGCYLIRKRLARAPRFVLSPKRRRVNALNWFLIVLCIIEIILMVRVYGTLPILSYIRGDNAIDVTTATERQANSAVGQLAFLNITIFALGGLLLEAAIIAIEQAKKIAYPFYLGLLTALFGGLINGKRVDTFRLLCFLGSGLLIYSPDALRNLTVIVPFFKRRIVAFSMLVLVVGGLISLFGPIAEIRNQGRELGSSYDQLVAYQEGPILNMEAQTQRTGYGPDRFDLMYPLQQMIPTKWIGSSGFFNAQPPPRVDTSSPSGFYELLQWSWGLVGIIAFPFMVGMICMWFYTKSRTKVQYLLCYSYLIFSLLLVHSFNEFLQAPVTLVPCIVLWTLGRMANTSAKAIPEPSATAS